MSPSIAFLCGVAVAFLITVLARPLTRPRTGVNEVPDKPSAPPPPRVGQSPSATESARAAREARAWELFQAHVSLTDDPGKIQHLADDAFRAADAFKRASFIIPKERA